LGVTPERSRPQTDASGAMRADISTAVVKLLARLYGRGPTKAKTYFNDETVLVVLEDLLTTNEQTLVDAGDEDLVRRYRLGFQAVIAPPMCHVVEDITGRTVVAYQSQIVFHPARGFEIFVLDHAPGDAEP